MAIAPSQLGRLVEEHWQSDEVLVQQLRKNELVREDAPDRDLHAILRMAREEHAALPSDEQEYNSPNERVRVFLAPFLTNKGSRWAVPLASLNVQDDDKERSQSAARSPWSKFWR